MCSKLNRNELYTTFTGGIASITFKLTVTTSFNRLNLLPILYYTIPQTIELRIVLFYPRRDERSKLHTKHYPLWIANTISDIGSESYRKVYTSYSQACNLSNICSIKVSIISLFEAKSADQYSFQQPRLVPKPMRYKLILRFTLLDFFLITQQAVRSRLEQTPWVARLCLSRFNSQDVNLFRYLSSSF